MGAHKKPEMKSPRRPAGLRAAAALAPALAPSSRSAIASRLGILIVSSVAALAGLALLSTGYLGAKHSGNHLTITSRLVSMNSAVLKGFSLGRAKKAIVGKRRDPLAGSWRPSQSGAAWIPQPNKYLLAYCMRGQSSNRNLCLRNHFILAGLLNRTLLLPFSQREQHLRSYDLSLRWDLDRTRRCLGSKVVTTTQSLRRRVLSLGASSAASTGSSLDPSAEVPAQKPSSVRLQCWQGPREVCGKGDATPVGDINCPEVVAHEKGTRSNSLPSGLSLQLDSSSHLYNLLAPFPHSISALVSPLSEETEQRQREQLSAGSGAIGAQGLLTWSTGEEGALNQSGGRARGGGGDAGTGTGNGTAELAVGASCLDRAQSASQVLEAFGGFLEDVLIVGDLVESQILHPLLAGGKVEHLFELVATSMVQECSWTVLVPSHYLIALSREIVAIVLGSPRPQPLTSRCTDGAPGGGCTGQEPEEKGRGGSGLPWTFVRELVLTNQVPDSAHDHASLDPSLSRELTETGPSKGTENASGTATGPLGRVGGYLSVHWRRGDFIGYCYGLNSDACTYVPKQAASCTVRHARKHGLHEIFLATNAEPEEIDTFHSEVAALSNGTMRVHMLTANFTTSPEIERWLEAHGVENATSQLKYSEAILEKLVSAQGTVFLASVESTFSKDIMEMRHRLGTWKMGDSFVCKGEKEWDWDDTGRPSWMVGQLKIRRWKARFTGAKGLTWEQKRKRKKVIEIMEWLDWRKHQKGAKELPKWYTNNTVWKAWKQHFGAEKGIGKGEKQLREWLLAHYQMIEDEILSDIKKAREGHPPQ